MKSPFSYRASLHVWIEDVKRIFIGFTDEERESAPINPFYELGLVVQLIDGTASDPAPHRRVRI
jgi:hypothetical protein